MADDTLANEVDAVAREVQGNRTRLLYVLRSNGFPNLAAAFERDTAGEQLEGEREYIGDPAPEPPRAGSAGVMMAFADGALNLFRPPPMPGAQVEQPVPGVLPAHAATPELFVDSTKPWDAAAREVLRQRGVYAPTDAQLRDVLQAAPWLGSAPVDEPEPAPSTDLQPTAPV